MPCRLRLATVVPLPTDAMLQEYQVAHAGLVMAQLEASGQDLLKEMAAAQACEWGGVPEEHVGGEMAQRVRFLADVMLRKVKQVKEEAMDEALTTLTRREIRHWALRNMGVNERMLPEPWTQEAQLGEA